MKSIGFLISKHTIIIIENDKKFADMSPVILRNNAIDILRKLEEIKLIHEIKILDDKNIEEENPELEGTNQNFLKSYKSQSGFLLIKNDRMGVDYFADIETQG